MDQEKVKEAREMLKKFDDARYGAMMRFWALVSDSPKKAGWTALVLCITAFLLGRWSK